MEIESTTFGTITIDGKTYEHDVVAISYLESRPEVDPDRIGLWGTSYAGGHALVLGATDRRIACIELEPNCRLASARRN